MQKIISTKSIFIKYYNRQLINWNLRKLQLNAMIYGMIFRMRLSMIYVISLKVNSFAIKIATERVFR